MLRLLSDILNQPIVAQNYGPIGSVTEAVIDKDTGKVAAYRLKSGKKFLSTVDVMEYLDEGILVASTDAVQSLDDLVRVQKILRQGVHIIGLKVATEQRRRLGTVADCAVDTIGHYLAKLHVRPVWWERLLASERIIAREDIVRITSKQVVVRYDVKAKPAGAEAEITQ